MDVAPVKFGDFPKLRTRYPIALFSIPSVGFPDNAP
jgi:hypothetical protein